MDFTANQSAALLNNNRCSGGAHRRASFVSIFSSLFSSFLGFFVFFFPLPPNIPLCSFYLSFSLLSFPVFLSVSLLLTLFCHYIILSRLLSHLVQPIALTLYFLQEMQIHSNLLKVPLVFYCSSCSVYTRVRYHWRPVPLLVASWTRQALSDKKQTCSPDSPWPSLTVAVPYWRHSQHRSLTHIKASAMPGLFPWLDCITPWREKNERNERKKGGGGKKLQLLMPLLLHWGHNGGH